MDQNQRRARIINMRKAHPIPHIRTAPAPDTVLADLDAIDAATEDPAIRAATARIRAALDGTGQPDRDARPCAECRHPQYQHREGDDPVTPGVCRTCEAYDPDEAHHDYRAGDPS